MEYALFLIGGRKMLEKLRQCSNVEEIVKCIKDFYHLYDIDNYILGIYKEGSFLFT